MILLTGATGLVGSHVLHALLLRGEKVRATKRASSNLNDVEMAFRFYNDGCQPLLQNVEWVEADLRNPVDVFALFDGIERVIHCAAIISFKPADKQKMIQQNPEITANLVNAALAAGVVHFAQVSSVAAIGRTKEFADEITEKTEWKNGPNNSNYAVSKYLAELEVWRGIEEGLCAAMVNPTIILGAGNWNQSSNALFKKFSKHFPFYTSGKNGFVDVRDVVTAVLKISDEKINNQRFLLAGENWTYQKLMTQMALAFEQKPPAKKSAAWLVNAIWRVEYVRSVLFNSNPLITKESARSAQNKWTYSARKAQDMLGIAFTPIQKSIDDFTAFYKKEYQL